MKEEEFNFIIKQLVPYVAMADVVRMAVFFLALFCLSVAAFFIAGSKEPSAAMENETENNGSWTAPSNDKMELLLIDASKGEFNDAVEQSEMSVRTNNPVEKYIFAKEKKTATATYSFEIRFAGEYFLAIRFLGHFKEKQVVKTVVDKKREFYFNFEYTAMYNSRTESIGFLEKGMHSLQIEFSGAEAKISQILLTNDKDYSANNLYLIQVQAEDFDSVQNLEAKSIDDAVGGKALESGTADTNSIVTFTVNIPWFSNVSLFFLRLKLSEQQIDANSRKFVSVSADGNEWVSCSFKRQDPLGNGWWHHGLFTIDSLSCISLSRGKHTIKVDLGKEPVVIDEVVFSNYCWRSCGKTNEKSCVTKSGKLGIRYCLSDWSPFGRQIWPTCVRKAYDYIQLRQAN